MSELSTIEKYNLMAIRIDKILKTGEFLFDVNFLKTIHKYLFTGIFENAGNFREVNLNRKEHILQGESVVYSNYFNIEPYLNYDMQHENIENYYNLTQDEFIRKLCLLNSKLWLTHPFNDGNTRTISVFIRLFLQKIGYKFDNELFRKYFSFYRNALVLASYSTPYLAPNNEYLELFFKKILFDEPIDLDNLDLHYNKVDIKKKIKINEQQKL